ncbi:hypothetical protein WR25_09910 [Diploscapter pachys]|uniref:Uncharacterized protein n=1 Tax=Diploscapter pachys TaxID=2018661 RepID=A0A2A2M3G0_9BILA|nr:hypothetical protein WR25_09910 [Diploscapter pachys]
MIRCAPMHSWVASRCHAPPTSASTAKRVEAAARRQVERQRRCGDAVGRRPIGVAVPVENLGGCEGGAAGCRGAGDGARREVGRKAAADRIAEALEHGDVMIGQATAAIGRQVEVHVGAARDRFIEEADQARGRLHLRILVGMVEPAGADRGVGFRRPPQGRAAYAAVAFRLDIGVVGHGRPAGVAGDAVFVADPADVRAQRIEGAGHRLMLMDQCDDRGPVIVFGRVDRAGFARAAIIAVAAVGAVEPEFEEFAVAGAEFDHLLAVIVDIFGAAVAGVVPIPGREVQAERQAVAARRLLHFADDIALAVLVGAVADAMLGQHRRPQAEAVMMLGGEDDAGHASGLRRGDDLVG